MTLFKIVSWTFFAYIAYCCLLFIFQRLILFPRYQIPTPPEKASEIPGLEEIWLKTSFGKVEAWFIPATTKEIAKPAPVVIFAHGNAELIDFWPEELRQFTSIGLAIFLVEYPGYGRSDGSPSQERPMIILLKETMSIRLKLFCSVVPSGAVWSVRWQQNDLAQHSSLCPPLPVPAHLPTSSLSPASLSWTLLTI